jgi:hypothetical protein
MNPDTVTFRFWRAYEELIDLDRIGPVQICRDLGVDRRNFIKIMKNQDHRHIRAEWLEVFVKYYGVSANWLLTGEGWMFGE